MKLAFFIIHYLFINDPGIGRTVTKTRYVQTERTKMPKTILSTYILSRVPQNNKLTKIWKHIDLPFKAKFRINH